MKKWKILWHWRCQGCKQEVDTDCGKLPAECGCGAGIWDKTGEKKSDADIQPNQMVI